ncbi:hypothetical protein GCM10007877_24760 [Marinibactrum halimedae]|uniref:Uncharacterized protein n=1 Tax=Marinibactrum halimedae TaxID=1444977 RepID=A0AA37TCJ5_9GAMM|nr:hypothetical protein GCM10007877_24760 [Marinibactrum halimedae]
MNGSRLISSTHIMINFKYPKEKEISLHYANAFSDLLVEKILNGTDVSNSDEALHLSKFYWEMVDALVEDASKNNLICGELNLQEWSELIFNSFRSYIRNAGFSTEWDKASDEN